MSETAPASQVWLWQGVLLVASQSLENTTHMHFPASLYVGLDKDVTVTTKNGVVTGRVVLVRANTDQSANSHEGRLIDVLIDADSATYRQLEPSLLERDAVALSFEPLNAQQTAMNDAVAGQLSCEQAWTLVEQLLISVCEYQPRAREFDPRVEKVAASLRADLPVNPDVQALAEQAGVSESRFMHLFKQQYGLPVRQYLLWARLRRSAELWQTGMLLADIAAEVGFYDQAHFARTVRRMFDFSPSWLANPVNLKLHNCSC